MPLHVPLLTVEVLDDRLQALLGNIIRSISTEVGKIAQELGGEIAQLDELTDHLETKFNDLIQYIQVLEEENHSLKHTQIQGACPRWLPVRTHIEHAPVPSPIY